jgi:23S rRNA (uracil1939-C5)-methyltransferase
LQLVSKQQALLDAFRHIGNVTAHVIMPAISTDWVHYRRKARLGIRHVEKKGGALVGFREKNNSYITPLHQCLTLTKPLSDLLAPLSELVNRLSVKKELPQIEIAEGENQISLVFRHLAPMTEMDLSEIRQFSIDFNVQTYLQPKGLDSIRPCYPADPQTLYYSLDEYRLRFYFSATDFIQVNAQANQLLLKKAMELLDPGPADTILDLYCGLGNFSLPIARFCQQVVAVEGDARMVDRAKFNARYNQVGNVDFQTQDLSDQQASFSWLNQDFDKVLLDPARSGAALMCEKLAAARIPEIVYISCNPATLARDAGSLVNSHGYTLTHAGIINMFPHTAHVESIAVFKR